MMKTGLNRIKGAGFTIVELLIVVVVIAILAAITIVAYNGVQNRAKSSAAQSAAQQASKKIQAFSISNSDNYPASLDVASVKSSDTTTFQYRVNNSSSPKSYCVTATTGGVSFFVSEAQQNPTPGVCSGHAPAGGTVITNLATNPSAEINNANYSTFGGLVFESSNEWASSGSRSFKARSPNTTDSGDFRFAGGGLNSLALSMEAGQTYTLSARVNIPVTFTGNFTRAPGVLLWVSTDGATYATNFGPKVNPAAGTYTVSHTFTLPSNTTGAELGFGAASSTANQIVYYDSIILTRGSTVHTFADGNTNGWAWSGAQNASTSFGPAP